eukprot:5273522-Prymnesium_polylepis.3
MAVDSFGHTLHAPSSKKGRAQSAGRCAEVCVKCASAQWSAKAIGAVALAVHAGLAATSTGAASIVLPCTPMELGGGAGHAPPPGSDVPRLPGRVPAAASTLGTRHAGTGGCEDAGVLAVAIGRAHVAADRASVAGSIGRACDACASRAVEGGAC